MSALNLQSQINRFNSKLFEYIEIPLKDSVVMKLNLYHDFLEFLATNGNLFLRNSLII